MRFSSFRSLNSRITFLRHSRQNLLLSNLYISFSMKSSSFIRRRDDLVPSPSADQKSTSVVHERWAVCRAHISLIP
uniref:Uncharacterized protein n=1 Tax=Zea mays TaxID=4577 RepID=C4J1A2_MAIZE|nr:unknown [Zea mays]